MKPKYRQISYFEVHLSVIDHWKRKKNRAGIWFNESVFDWM